MSMEMQEKVSRNTLLMKVSKRWGIVAVVAFGSALVVMDGTIVAVILSQLQTAFQTDFGTITWAVTTYFLAQAAVVPVTGYVSDRVGSKLVFLAALALFTTGSLLCALAPTKEALFVFRALQGIGGGAMVPITMSIVYRIFPPSERGPVTAAIGIPLLLAPAFGPTIGGYLSTSFNWNAVFIINVPCGILALFLSFLILPGRESDQSEQTDVARKRLDIPGLLLSIVGVTALIYGIMQAGSKGWDDQTVLIPILIGVAVLVVFIVVELRVHDPILDLRLFTNYTFTISNILTWVILGVFYGGQFLLPLFLENVRGDTALTTGESLIGQGLAFGVGITIAGVVYNRLGPRILTVFGFLLVIGGTYGLTQIDVNTTGQSLQIWLLLRGLGMGFVSQPLQTVALSVVSNRGMAKASSLVNVTRQMAIAVAVAVLTTYLTGQVSTHANDISNALQTHQLTGVAAICAQTAGQSRQLQACVVQHATATGMADTFWIILILSAVCVPLALVIGRDPAIEAYKQQQEHAPVTEVNVASMPNVISTLTANGEEIMGPEILLWRYPENDVVNGSLLTVESSHFCVLKLRGAILNVYETGQHIVQTLGDPLFGSVQQLAFNGELMPLQYEALYINRAKLFVKTTGVAISREMVEVNYSVNCSIHVATCEDAVRLVQYIPYRGHTLTIQEISAYAEPVIEQALNQLVQVASLGQAQRLQMQDLSQRVHLQLQSFLSPYGITLDEVNVLGLGPRDEAMKALLLLKAFGLSELDAVRYYIAMQENAKEKSTREQNNNIEQNLYIIWRNALEHYADEIAAIQAELESARANLSLYVDTHSARLQELSRAISSGLRASTPHSDTGITPLPDVTPLSSFSSHSYLTDR
jgi:EmrB/QacA subfamily drug resistance transporter